VHNFCIALEFVGPITEAVRKRFYILTNAGIFTVGFGSSDDNQTKSRMHSISIVAVRKSNFHSFWLKSSKWIWEPGLEWILPCRGLSIALMLDGCA